ncbi:hypothetical protein LSH36_39g00083 [Paralvinella palmiformis]|uniref:Fucosyltransferase n=1 Tax=Paralvinella palmiformis TaxID=53620 RepID=A0AAD9K7W0_9ANNE|nr:hypothetical protein LSH36_39g00083 [Paralvinella palmiformis]
MLIRRNVVGFLSTALALFAGLTVYKRMFNSNRNVKYVTVRTIYKEPERKALANSRTAPVIQSTVSATVVKTNPGRDGINEESTLLSVDYTEMFNEGDQTAVKTISPNIESNKSRLTTILFWNPWFRWKDYKFGLGQKVFIKKCGTDQCQTITDRSRQSEVQAVVFFGGYLNDRYDPVLPPRSDSEQVYVYLNTEPPSKYPTVFSKLRHDFNITISYKLDSTIYWPYGRVLPREDERQTLTNLDMATKNRTVAWMVSICEDVNMRMTYYEELKKYIQVDMYGKCGQLKCHERGRKTTECIEYLSKYYKFYLAFENSHCVDYVTEKAFRSLQYDLIPIVMGGANYTKYLPPKSYIDVKDFQSPKHLAEYLIHLDNNPDEYMKYFDWKRYYTVVNDIPNSNRVFCELCELLRKNRSFLLDYNLADWWENDTCVNDVTMLRSIYHIT